MWFCSPIRSPPKNVQSYGNFRTLASLTHMHAHKCTHPCTHAHTHTHTPEAVSTMTEAGHMYYLCASVMKPLVPFLASVKIHPASNLLGHDIKHAWRWMHDSHIWIARLMRLFQQYLHNVICFHTHIYLELWKTLSISELDIWTAHLLWISYEGC